MIDVEPVKDLGGSLIGGRYQLRYRIGEGGMSTVWAAEDLSEGRMVAAKFLSQSLARDAQARMRFEREAQLIARIRSPYVVQVFGQGCTDDDTPYLIMELLDGEDLASCLARWGPCDLIETDVIVEQVCLGLGAAHSEGLVHRDIKPHNIFLTHDDKRVSVKLLDFGIAKDLSFSTTARTAQGELIGSALYISPEQLRDPQSVGPATDVWSVGVVIYQMLTSRLPFEASTWFELIERYLDGRVPAVTSIVPGLPSQLDAFFARALHTDARERWQSVEALAHEFSAIVHRESPQLRLDTETAPRASRFAWTRIAQIAVLAIIVAIAWRFWSSPAPFADASVAPANEPQLPVQAIAEQAPEPEPVIQRELIQELDAWAPERTSPPMPKLNSSTARHRAASKHAKSRRSDDPLPEPSGSTSELLPITDLPAPESLEAVGRNHGF